MKFTMVIHNSNKVVVPMWDFITEKLQTDKIMNIPIDFKNIVKSINMEEKENLSIFTSNTLWSLVELARYMLVYHKILAPEDSHEFIHEMSENLHISLVGKAIVNGAYISEYPIADFSILFRSMFYKVLPDHPYVEFWADKYLDRISMKMNIGNPIEFIHIVHGLFQNITVEKLDLTFNNSIDPNVLKSMFINTNCRIVECTFNNCRPDYRLTRAAFSNISFTYPDMTKYTGYAYIECTYKESNKTHTEKIFIS